MAFGASGSACAIGRLFETHSVDAQGISSACTVSSVLICIPLQVIASARERRVGAEKILDGAAKTASCIKAFPKIEAMIVANPRITFRRIRSEYSEMQVGDQQRGSPYFIAKSAVQGHSHRPHSKSGRSQVKGDRAENWCDLSFVPELSVAL